MGGKKQCKAGGVRLPRMMTKTLIMTCVPFVVVFSPSPSFGQKAPDFKDTLKVTAGTSFTIRDLIFNWSQDPTRLSCRVEIDPKFPEGSKDAGKCSIIKVSAAKPGVYLTRIVARLEKPGVYYLIRTVVGPGLLTDRIDTVSYYWVIHAVYPVLNPNLDSTYYFGEPGYFDFGTGHDTLGSFSYEVVDENSVVVLKGRGSVVSLDSITGVEKHVGRTFTIRGLREGQVFRYQDALTSRIDSSVWQFRLLKPQTLTQFASAWAEEDEPERRPILFIDPSRDPFTCRFRFIYYSEKKNSFILKTPAISNLRVQSKPPDFLSNPAFNLRPTSLGAIVEVKPNLPFLQSLPGGQARLVEIEMEFDTQFEHLSKKFRAFVR